MNSALVEFAVQSLAGIVGVFVGVWLALVADHRKRIRDDRRHEEELARQFDLALHSILGSVVKNMAEAKRIHGRVDRRGICALIHEGLETSVWDATQDQFMELCGSVDKRVIFAQFFNGVRRLQAFCEFHRDLQLTIAGATDPEDSELATIGREADLHLKDLTDELGFCGRLLIGDHGQPVHQRLLGMKPTSRTSASEPA